MFVCLIYWLGQEKPNELFGPPNTGSDSKESTCNAGDLGSIPGWERSLEEGMATDSSILAWRIPWTEEPGRQQSIGSNELDMTEVT